MHRYYEHSTVEDIEAIVSRMRVENMDIPELAAWARGELVSEFGRAPRRAARGSGACAGRMQQRHILCSAVCAWLETMQASCCCAAKQVPAI